MSSTPRTLGVLGGMGPMATVDFLHKLTAATPAERDQDHVPLVVHFCSHIPDRTDALIGRGPSPLPGLLAAARSIESSGAQALVMPCNTAHAWYDAIAASLTIPVLHIADAAIEAIPQHLRQAPVGILATQGTLQSGVYSKRHGTGAWLIPSDAVTERQVMPAIRAIKRNDFITASRLLRIAIEHLRSRGAHSIILGCTELPITCANDNYGVALVDATQALAQRAIRWATEPELQSA